MEPDKRVLAHLEQSRRAAERGSLDEAVLHVRRAGVALRSIEADDLRTRLAASVARSVLGLAVPPNVLRSVATAVFGASEPQERTVADVVALRALALAADVETDAALTRFERPEWFVDRLPEIVDASDLERDDVLDALLRLYVVTREGAVDGTKRVDGARSRAHLTWLEDLRRFAAGERLDDAATRMAQATAGASWAYARVAVAEHDYAEATADFVRANELTAGAKGLRRLLLSRRAMRLLPEANRARSHLLSTLADTLDGVLEGYDTFGSTLPGASDAQLSTEYLGIAYEIVEMLPEARQEARFRSVLDRSVPAALRLDARAAASADLAVRDGLLRLASSVWGIAFALSRRLADGRMTAELLVARRASLVLATELGGSIPDDLPEPVLEEGDPRPVAPSPDLALAASSALVAAVDGQGIPVRPRPLVLMPDGRVALERYISALTDEQRAAWTSPYVVPLA